MVLLGGDIEDGGNKSGAKPPARQVGPQPQTHVQYVIPAVLAAADSGIRPVATETHQLPRKPDRVIGVPRIEESPEGSSKLIGPGVVNVVGLLVTPAHDGAGVALDHRAEAVVHAVSPRSPVTERDCYDADEYPRYS